MGAFQTKPISSKQTSRPPPKSLFPASSFQELEIMDDENDGECCMSIPYNLGFFLEGTKNNVRILTRLCEKKPEIGDLVYYCKPIDSPCEEKVYKKGQVMSVSKEGSIHVIEYGQSSKGAVHLTQDNWYYC